MPSHPLFFVTTTVLTISFLAIMHLWATSSFPWLAGRRRGLAAACAGLFVVQAVTGWATIEWHSRAADAIHTVLVVAVMTMGIAAIPMVLLRVLGWAVDRRRRTRGDGHEGRAGNASPGPEVTRRQLVEGAGGVAVLGVSGAVLGWGAVRGRHMFELNEVPVRIPGLPRALDGYVIAQVSDIHVGVHVGDRELSEGLALVRRARPDLVVITGDIVDMDASYAPFAARRLSDLPSRDGVVAILGNHDYYAGAEAVVAALRAAGIVPLVNEGRRIRAGDGGGFALLGVDDLSSVRHHRAGPLLDRALAMVPPDAPRILLSHQPPTVDRWAGQVALQLSGHTHGGQINPGFRPADLFFRYVAGSYEVGGTTLYVNRGFGTVGPPSRVGAPPEVTRIVLVAA